MRWVVVAALLIACGDDDSGTGEYVAVADFDTAYKDAECTYLTTCGLFPDKDTCLAAQLFNGGSYSLSPDLRAEIGKGHVVYNGTAVKTCFDAIANATCDKTDEAGRVPVLACFMFTHGTLGADAPCLLNEACISQDCRITVADESCAMGTCVGNTAPTISIPVNGEPCNSVVGCGRGSYCDVTSTVECMPLKVAGDSCIDTRECAYGLGCTYSIGSTGTTQICKTLPAPNEGCPDAVCRDEGQHCIGAVCKSLGLVGGTCASSNDCSPYFQCDFATNMCKKPPSIGDACMTANLRCFDEHSYCDGTTLRCVAGKPDGAPCTSGLQCASENCDFASSTCVTQSCSG